MAGHWAIGLVLITDFQSSKERSGCMSPDFPCLPIYMSYVNNDIYISEILSMHEDRTVS